VKIKLRHVERFKDRHGRIRWYFRRGEGARIAAAIRALIPKEADHA